MLIAHTIYLDRIEHNAPGSALAFLRASPHIGVSGDRYKAGASGAGAWPNIWKSWTSNLPRGSGAH
jgi:hypothetical protein